MEGSKTYELGGEDFPPWVWPRGLLLPMRDESCWGADGAVTFGVPVAMEVVLVRWAEGDMEAWAGPAALGASPPKLGRS